MVALTLDKMAEFYAAQQRYTEAETVATAALELRTKTYIASLNQTGRVLLMEAKMDDAVDLYHRTAQFGELAKAPDDAMDAPLRIYATILREMKRDDEAAAVTLGSGSVWRLHALWGGQFWPPHKAKHTHYLTLR